LIVVLLSLVSQNVGDNVFNFVVTLVLKVQSFASVDCLLLLLLFSLLQGLLYTCWHWINLRLYFANPRTKAIDFKLCVAHFELGSMF
jgi:hypothetical protein